MAGVVPERRQTAKGGVLRGDAYVGSEERLYLLFRGADAEHGSCGQRLHKAAAARATRRSPSSSEKTPASVAATNSPMLWPDHACGCDAPGEPELERGRTR